MTTTEKQLELFDKIQKGLGNLSKQYRLGSVGSGTMRNDLTRWWAGLRGKYTSFL